VAGDFVTKKKDNYHFADAAGRAVKLPGQPGIAIRAINIGGPADRPDPNAFIDPNATPSNRKPGTK
jgi:hypothetical protein